MTAKKLPVQRKIWTDYWEEQVPDPEPHQLQAEMIVDKKTGTIIKQKESTGHVYSTSLHGPTYISETTFPLPTGVSGVAWAGIDPYPPKPKETPRDREVKVLKQKAKDLLSHYNVALTMNIVRTVFGDDIFPSHMSFKCGDYTCTQTLPMARVVQFFEHGQDKHFKNPQFLCNSLISALDKLNSLPQ